MATLFVVLVGGAWISALAMTVDITFRVEIPVSTPPGESVYLTILPFHDWAWLERVELIPSGDGKYEATVPLERGMIVRYVYDRWNETGGGEWKTTRESSGHLPIDSRLLLVPQTSETAEDIVAAWLDVGGNPTTGTLKGRVVDSVTGQPLPDTNVTAGGIHIASDYDGYFEFPELAAGTQRVMAMQTIGDHHSGVMEVTISEGQVSEIEFALIEAEAVDFTFEVTLPADTPADAEIQILGSVYQTGARIAGYRLNAPPMPTTDAPLMERSGNTATLTLHLYDGLSVQYVYSVSDVWHGAERTASGAVAYRTFVVDPLSPRVNQRVEQWAAPGMSQLSIRLTVPDWTPTGVPVGISFGPTYWMTPADENEWVYYLYGWPGQGVSYQYMLGASHDGIELGKPMRSATFGIGDVEVHDTIRSWAYIPDGWTGGDPASAANDATSYKADLGFAAGYCLDDYWGETFYRLLPTTYERIRAHNGTWVEVSSVWSYGQTSPLPMIEERPLTAPSVLTPREVLVDQIQLAHQYGLRVLVAPQFNMEMSPDGGIVCGAHTAAWWTAWLDEARKLWMWNAQVAQDTGAEALLLPGNCFHIFPDRGSFPSEADAVAFDNTIQALITQIRTIYDGILLIGYAGTQHVFPGLADWVGTTTFQTGHPGLPASSTVAEWEVAYNARFTATLDPLYATYGKPVVLYQIHVPSLAADGDPYGEQAQARQMEGLMRAIISRKWIVGAFSFAYRLVDAPLQPGYGVRGRAGEDILAIYYDKATSAVFRVVADGNVATDGTLYASAFESGSADVAEWVLVSEEVEPGDVLELNPRSPMTYRKSSGRCSTLIAGVVSTNPGLVLGTDLLDSHSSTIDDLCLSDRFYPLPTTHYPLTLLALTGIVPVKVTNEGGAIQPGDLLVSSSTPGHAMRWDQSMEGCISLLGKALEPMSGENGVILVLLTAP